MTIAAPAPFDDLFEVIDQMTVRELVDFIGVFEERYGVSATPPATTTVIEEHVEETPVEEQTEFAVTLTSVGTAKIAVIKVVREMTDLGLKEAKDLVDAAPKAVKSDLSRDEAERVATALREVGAEVSIE